MEKLPLRNVVLCCTSLPPDFRDTLAEKFVNLGAKHQLDLTSDVTHLVGGCVRSAKYRYVAKERPDVRVLHADFVDAVRDNWKQDIEVDLSELETTHRLPPLFGLRVCLTGFEDLQVRQQISDSVSNAGAEFHGDLTKVVTHLIAKAPKGSKYTHAKQWGITIVSPKWLEDSLRRGMALDESLYDPCVPEEEQGKGAFRTEPKPRTSLGKRPRGETKDESSSSPFKRKLRRTASTRLHSQSQCLLHDMSVREYTAEAAETSQWDDTAQLEIDRSRSVTARIEVDRSHTMSLGSTAAEEVNTQFVLLLHWDKQKRATLRSLLQANGTTVVDTIQGLERAKESAGYKASYILIPHDRPEGVDELPVVPPGTSLVSEWWVERCISQKRLIDPQHDILCQPLWNLSIPAFVGLKIGSSGFGSEVRHVAIAIALAGAEYEENLNPSLSVFVSGPTPLRPEKAMYASKHSIPVVSAEWLWACLRTRSKVSLTEYLIKLRTYDPSLMSSADASKATPGATDPFVKKVTGSSKLKETLNSVPQRLSNTRNRVTLSLSMHANRAESTTNPPKRILPFVHEDDDADDNATGELQTNTTPTNKHETLNSAQSLETQSRVSPGARDRALEERSPNISPQKQDLSVITKNVTTLDETTLVKDTFTEEANTVTIEAVAVSKQQIRPSDEIAAEMALFVNRARKGEPTPIIPTLTKRKDRPLGRNLSGANFSVQRSTSILSDRASHTSDVDDDTASSTAAKGSSLSRADLPPPSTQIGYGDPEAEAHRLQMEKRMKVHLDDSYNRKRLASVGTVKDTSNETQRRRPAIESRAQTRTKKAKFPKT